MIVPNLQSFRKLESFQTDHNFFKDNSWDYLNPKKIEEKIFKEIPENVLFIGYDYYDPDEPFFIPFDKDKRITILIQGRNGSGKSILFKRIVYDNLHLRQGRYVLDCGAKADSQTIRSPNTNPKYLYKIRKFGGKPVAYSYAKYITPYFLRIPGAIGDPFSLSVKGIADLIKFNATIGMKDIYGIFNTKMEDSSGTALLEFFSGKKPPPNTVKELEKLIENYTAKNPQMKHLTNQFSALTNTSKLTDNYIYYPELLKKHKILCCEFQVVNPDDNNVQTVFLNNIIQTVMQDRVQSIVSNNTQGYIDVPPVVALDEGDVFAADGTSTSYSIRELLTKYREINPQKASEGIKTAGCDLVLSTQHLSALDKYIVAEADYIITSKLQLKADAEVLKHRGLSSGAISFLQTMPYPDTYPKPFAIIYPDNSIALMYPAETLSWMK